MGISVVFSVTLHCASIVEQLIEQFCSKTVSHVLISQPEKRGINRAAHFLGSLAQCYPRSNLTSTSPGWRVGESGKPRPSCKKGNREAGSSASPEFCQPVHSGLWFLRESNVRIILLFFNFALIYLVTITTPWYLCPKKKSSSEQIQPVFSKDKPITLFSSTIILKWLSPPSSCSLLIPIMSAKTRNTFSRLLCLLEASPQHRHGTHVQAQHPCVF